MGIQELREAVASLYNYTYRQGKLSQYTHENVCIVPGGRSGLSRIAAVLEDVCCAHQIPDCTTYEQVLSLFKKVAPIPIALEQENGFRPDLNQFYQDISTGRFTVGLASNPCNPTGQILRGRELLRLVEMARRQDVTLILDESYSWYIYPDNDSELGISVSSAEFIDDVDEDPIIILDGLTKNWRLPGWRIGWVVGPKNAITALSQSGSFLEGGAACPLQYAAVPLLDPTYVHCEKVALQRHFRLKRDHVLTRLTRLGLRVAVPPESTFYIWLGLQSLPPPFNNGLMFFEELLKEKCIVIPGIFFDINPMHRRNLSSSLCHQFVRLSFGPPIEILDKGLDSIARMLKRMMKMKS